MPMTTPAARPSVTNIPFIWRLHLTLHGVRLSRPASDDPAAVCDATHLTYRATMADGQLAGVESAPLEVRINIRAASFVLRAFGQQSAEIRADRSGALFAIQGRPHEIHDLRRPAHASVRVRCAPASIRRG